MVRWLVVVLAVLAVPFALLVDGCAAIVGLDESYPLADGGEGGTRDDGSVADASLRDAAADSTVPMADASADGATQPTDAALDADAAAWRFDDTYGDGGLVRLAYVTGTIVPPVIAVDDLGTVRVVYNDEDAGLHLCTSPFSDADSGCQPVLNVGDPLTGYPAELLSGSGVTVLVVNAVATPSSSGANITVLSVPDQPSSYQLKPGCFAARGLGLDDGGNVTVAAACASHDDILTFAPGVHNVEDAMYTPSTPTLYTASAGTAGDAWFLGCADCGGTSNASYVHLDTTATALADGVVSDGVHQLYAGDLLARADGGLLAGTYFGSTNGLFTAVVPSTGGPQPPLPANRFDLGAVSPQAITSGRTVIATPATGLHVVVAGVTSAAAIALVTVDDDGNAVAPWSTLPQTIPFATNTDVSSVVLGGAATYEGAVYLALEGSIPGGIAIGVAKLVH